MAADKKTSRPKSEADKKVAKAFNSKTTDKIDPKELGDANFDLRWSLKKKLGSKTGFGYIKAGASVKPDRERRN